MNPVLDRSFLAAHARGGGWAEVAKSCADQLRALPPGANLGFLYATDALAADLGSVRAERTRENALLRVRRTSLYRLGGHSLDPTDILSVFC